MPFTPPKPVRKPEPPQSFFSSLLDGFEDNDIRKFLRDEEGGIGHMYRDTTNNVTIGVGHLIPSANDAAGLPFERRQKPDEPGPRASRDEIIQAFRGLPPQRTGVSTGDMYGANYFAPRPGWTAPLFLDKAEVNRLFDEDIREHRRRLENQLPSFGTFPPSARKALLDLQYNTDFRKETWPQMFRALDQQDWEEAGRQSRRKGIGETRNNNILELFRNALTESKKN